MCACTYVDFGVCMLVVLHQEPLIIGLFCGNVLQCVAVCLLRKCVAVCCSVSFAEMCCSVLQCVFCGNDVRSIAGYGSSTPYMTCTTFHTYLFSCALQHAATRCNTLQHTATRCNTLQHTWCMPYDMHYTPRISIQLRMYLMFTMTPW